ncbi:MAG: flagellar basal body rod protein FlgC [Bacteroidales bacterium]|nr:flagellar basal body rod protein FlgC [Candidatus Latescibacterota bacterium]
MQGTGLFRTMNISASGLSVQRMKLDVIAENLANIETTRTRDGGPYKRKTVSITPVKEKGISSRGINGPFESLLDQSSRIDISSTGRSMYYRPEGRIVEDENTPYTLKYDPGHPDANTDGVVTMPNVNVIDEMVDMITATRAYEANVTAIQAAKDMFLKAIEI